MFAVLIGEGIVAALLLLDLLALWKGVDSSDGRDWAVRR